MLQRVFRLLALMAVLQLISGVSVANNLASTPLVFTKNMGQWPEEVLFRTDAGGATVWITTTGVTYQFTRRVERTDASLDASSPDASGRQTSSSAPDETWAERAPRGLDTETDSIETMIIKAGFVGSNLSPEVVADGLMEYKCNYFLGNDPARWRTDVSNYTAVTLRNVYDGVDLSFFANYEGKLAYQYDVAPGMGVSQIEVAYAGGAEVSASDDGQTTARTEWGEIRGLLAEPLDDANEVSCITLVAPGESPMNGRELAMAVQGSTSAIGLAYSTYLGGNRDESAKGIAVDNSGCAFVAGSTGSGDFPTHNAFDSIRAERTDVFVTKFSPSGTELIYSTYLGGVQDDVAVGIAVDNSGCAYITGTTNSYDYPVQNAFDSITSHSSIFYDDFVTKLSPAGNSLEYSTFLGGSSSERAGGIAVDGSGCAYVTGSTYSADFPTVNAYDAIHDNAGGIPPTLDAFVSKLSSSGNSLVFSTFLGGASEDLASDVRVDAFGCLYVTGYTASPDFPTTDAFDAIYNPGGYYRYDIFITKFTPAGDQLLYSTYLGGSSDDVSYGLDIDDKGCAFVTGWTHSVDFPMQNAFDASYGDHYDAFVTRLSASGNSLIYSTFLGGSVTDQANDVMVDRYGYAYVTGGTNSSDFPTSNAFDDSNTGGGTDVFIVRLSASGSRLAYSTYLGRDGYDAGIGIAADRYGCAYVCGVTASPSFPTENAYDAFYHAHTDAFVTKFSSDYLCGDADGDMELTAADIDYLRAFYFSLGQQPPTITSADMNCDGVITISDVIMLVGYYYGFGPTPCCAVPPATPDSEERDATGW